MDNLNRKLGLVENLFHILHDLGAMIDVNVARIEGALRGCLESIKGIY